MTHEFIVSFAPSAILTYHVSFICDFDDFSLEIWYTAIIKARLEKMIHEEYSFK